MSAITILDYIGVFAFSISGVLAASGKKLDLFGGFIVAFVTALGGGTLRDILLDAPLTWTIHTEYIYIVIAGLVFALVFKNTVARFRKTMFLFDTIGISLFTVLGVEKALALNMPVEIAVMFGAMTATFGGVIRDILCNEIPLVFRKEIYAMACVLGAVVYIIGSKAGLPPIANVFISGSVIMAIRTWSVLKKFSLPVINDAI